MRKTTNNKQIAYEFIRDAVLRGEIKPGHPVTEEWLGKNLNMSRTPVREALIRLHGEGLISMVNNRVAVTPITPVDIQEIFELRLLLEPYAARICIGMIDRSKLEDIRKFTETELNREKVVYKTSVHDLHDAIIESTRNSRLIHILRNLQSQITRLLNVAGRIPGRAFLSMQEHLQIIDAILAGDGVKAEKRMQSHLQSNMNDMLDAKNFNFIFKE